MFNKLIQRYKDNQQQRQESKSIKEIQVAFNTRKLSSLAERRKAIIYLRRSNETY